MSASKDSFLIWNSEFRSCTFGYVKLNLSMHITTAYRCLDAYLQFLTLSIRYWLIHGQASQDSQCFLLAGLMNHNMSREIHRREKGGREGVRFRHKINQCNHLTLPLCYYSAKADIFTRTTAHCLDKCGILWYVIVHQKHAINLTTALLLNPHSSVVGDNPGLTVGCWRWYHWYHSVVQRCGLQQP